VLQERAVTVVNRWMRVAVIRSPECGGCVGIEGKGEVSVRVGVLMLVEGCWLGLVEPCGCQEDA